MVVLEDLLAGLVERHGSDLHISAGSPPKFRLDGELGLEVGPLPRVELAIVIGDAATLEIAEFLLLGGVGHGGAFREGRM